MMASSQPIWTKLAVLAVERLRQPVRRFVETDVVTPAIAEPAVGDRIVFLDQHRPQQRAVAHVGELLAADRALRAARLRAVQVPRPRLEAIRLRRQRADRTELRHVSGKVMAVRATRSPSR